MREAQAAGSGDAETNALILVVERDVHVRRLERYLLEEAGYQVQFADDGLSALQLAREVKPALVITEVLVPKRDGLALCRDLKSKDDTRAIRVLVLSILACEDRAREAGADGYLRKPLSETSLVGSVRALIGQLERSGHASS